MSKRKLSFDRPGTGFDLDEISDQFPYKQTQALLLVIDEAEAWIEFAMEILGSSHNHPQLREIDQWLAQSSDLMEDLGDAVYDDEDDSIAMCRLTADHELYDALDEHIDGCPCENIELEVDDDALNQFVDNASDFITRQVRAKLQRVIAIATGDGDPLAILKHNAIKNTA